MLNLYLGVPTNCNEPGIPMNGACKLNSTLEGGVLMCQCCEMCKLIGSSVRMCMSDGKWSGMQPVCIQDGKIMMNAVHA